MALLIALVVAILIGAFQILGLDLAAIQTIISSGDLVNDLMALGALLFAQLIFPYTAATQFGAYAPLVALGVAGFIAGLISKSGVRMLFVSIICLVLFFLGFAVLTMSADPTNVAALWSMAQAIAIDLGAAFGLLFIPGVIGASLTAEEY
jgi:hypothetical protein